MFFASVSGGLVALSLMATAAKICSESATVGSNRPDQCGVCVGLRVTLAEPVS